MHLYVIVNSANGKYYIGKTECSKLSTRWKQHLWAAASGARSAIYAAMRKHGSDKFTIHSIIEIDNAAQLNQIEREWIAATGSRDPRRGYNCTDGGEGIRGLSRSAEHARKLSEKAKQRWATPEWREKVLPRMKGVRITTAERKQEIREFMKQRWADGSVKIPQITATTKSKMSAMAKRRWQDPVKREKMLANRTYQVSDATRAKISEAKQRVNTTPEYRKKMAQSISQWWAKRKAEKVKDQLCLSI